jgi:large subunit ribosomal protein L24
MKLKKNDSVVIIAGKDKGKRGKVLLVDIKKDRVIVEGVNKKKKYLRATQENPKGSALMVEYPLHSSNVMYFCEKCKKGVRLGVSSTSDSRQRVCRKCGKSLD